jgi:hypothetical protein
MNPVKPLARRPYLPDGQLDGKRRTVFAPRCDNVVNSEPSVDLKQTSDAELTSTAVIRQTVVLRRRDAEIGCARGLISKECASRSGVRQMLSRPHSHLGSAMQTAS